MSDLIPYIHRGFRAVFLVSGEGVATKKILSFYMEVS